MQRSDAAFADTSAKRGAGVGQHPFSSVREQREVCEAVADVGEAILAKAVVECAELLVSSKVGCAVTAKNAAEDSEMIGYPLSQPDVGPGSQIDFAAARVLHLQELEELSVVRQVDHIEFDVRSDERFECSFALQDGTRKLE